MRWLIFSFAFCVMSASIVGCKDGDRHGASKMDAPQASFFGAPSRREEAGHDQGDRAGPRVISGLTSTGNLDKQPKADEPAKKDRPRKIRYTGDIQLIVKDINDAEEALDAASKAAKGEYERAEVNRSANVVRSGIWRIRVPVENLTAFRKAVAKIGDVEKDVLESEDMTAKYYDLEAHLANRKAERDAVRDFLTEIGKKDPRFLEVKRELNEISDDINRKEGMIKLWKDMTDLTTFTVHMREKQAYNPPAPPKIEPDPSFGERVGKTWEGSWSSFIGFCQGVAIVAVALAPWSPVILVGLFFVWFVARRMSSRAEESAPVVEVVDEKPKGERSEPLG